MHAARFPRLRKSLDLCSCAKALHSKKTMEEGLVASSASFLQIFFKGCLNMLFLCLLLSFAACYVLIPPVIALAWRIGAVDVPMDWRRMHYQSIPRAGGIAIFAAFALSCRVFGFGDSFLISTLCGGALMLAVGLADDIFCLPAFFKLLFQVAAAVAAVLGSGAVEGRGTVWAVLWVVTLTNAHNFIDGLDGLFSGCAAIEGLALGLALMLMGTGDLAVIPLLLSAACFAFRFFNRYPAQIFAGDCGSGSVGFLLGALSLPLFQGATVERGASVILLFVYPLTDLFCAVLRRVLRGKSPFHADRGHLHHRICDAGVGKQRCVAILLGISFGFCGLAVLIGAFHLYEVASIACIFLATALITVRHRIALQTQKG